MAALERCPLFATIAFVDGRGVLRLRPWQRELHLHAELALVVSTDVPRGDAAAAEAALAGYSLGLGIWDNAMVADLKNKTARDVCLNQHYAYLIDGNRRQGLELLAPEALPPLNRMILTVRVPGLEPAAFPQSQLLFDGPRLLRECNKLMGFRRGDVFCLGPTDAPIVIRADDRFPDNAVLHVEGPPFAPLIIPVEDHRSPDLPSEWPGCTIDFVARYPHLRHL